MIAKVIDRGVIKFDILLEGVSFLKTTSIELKAKLLEKALNRMDTDINRVAKCTAQSNFSPFYWCLTYDDHRFDTTKRTVLDYYLIEILIYLVDKKRITEVHFYKFFDAAVLSIVTERCQLSVRNKCGIQAKLRDWIRYKLGSFKQVSKLMKHSFTLNKTKRSFNQQGNQFDVILSAQPNGSPRWKGYDKKVLEVNKNLLFLHPGLFQYSFNRKWKPLRLLNPASILSVLQKTFNFKRDFKSIQKHENVEDNLFFCKVKKQSFLQSLVVFMRFTILRKLFSENIRAVHVMTTFGDPLKRLVLAAADSENTKKNIFSCRPALSYLRSEDRLIQADFMSGVCNLAEVNFYGFDAFSRRHIEISKFPVNFVSWKTAKNESKEVVSFNSCFLILFAYHSYNEMVVSTLEKRKDSLPKNIQLLLREHQSIRLNKQQMIRLERLGYKITVITDCLWSELSFKNTLAVVGDSTAGLDALERGCSLVWLAYASEFTTVSFPIMDKVGQIVQNENELADFIEMYFGQEKAATIDLLHQSQYQENIALDNN